MTERAAKLYPYQYPGDGESDLIKQYGTAEDLKDWESIVSQCDDLISRKEMIPDINLVRLADIQTRAERRFYEETLRGDYELFKELVIMTVNDYSPETAVYHFTDEEEAKSPEYLRFSFSLMAHCLIFIRAESYYGWDKIRDEKGRKFTHAAMLDRTAELFPEASDALQKDLEQLKKAIGAQADTLDELGAIHTADDQQNKRYTMTIKPEYLTYTIDKVNYQLFEGLLMGLDPKTKKPHDVPMTAKKAGKGVSVYVSLSFEDANISTPLDINDCDMLNLVYSYMIAGNNSISLCRMLETYGEPRPTAKQLEEAYTRLYKLRSADITIDCKEWAKKKNKKAYSIYKRRILDGITFEEIRKETNGELLDVLLHCTIAVSDLPLYRFANTCDQITQVPMRTAMITGDNSITAKTAAIRHMLLDRIIKHHNSDRSGKVAKLDTIYEKINATTKTEKNRARKQIEKFMLEWVKNGTLYGFAFRKNGRSMDAVVFARDEKEMKEAEAENANLCEWYHR